jgi:hypothetical protein
MDPILFEMLDKPHIVTVTFRHETGAIVKVRMEGNGLCCRDIRNRILGPQFGWTQLKLEREVVE